MTRVVANNKNTSRSFDGLAFWTDFFYCGSYSHKCIYLILKNKILRVSFHSAIRRLAVAENKTPSQ